MFLPTYVMAKSYTRPVYYIVHRARTRRVRARARVLDVATFDYTNRARRISRSSTAATYNAASSVLYSTPCTPVECLHLHCARRGRRRRVADYCRRESVWNY